MKNHIFKLAAAEDASPDHYRAAVFVGGYGVRWLCEVMQEVK